ncbi:MAG TPA: response regulator [Labilithrix sp.]|nr:response regulator [Labilithrix sp.]
MTPSAIILLVEDNDDDAELTEIAFKRARIANKIVRARDGVEALDWLHRRGPHADRREEEPAVILLDLNMPKMSGIDVLKAIRADERLRRLPVVVLTSSDDDRDRFSAYDNFANSYIRKPVDHEQFTEAARELGLYWLVLNVGPRG